MCVIRASRGNISYAMSVVAKCIETNARASASVARFINERRVFVHRFVVPALRLLPINGRDGIGDILTRYLIPLRRVVPLPVRVLHVHAFRATILQAKIKEDNYLVRGVIYPFGAQEVDDLSEGTRERNSFRVGDYVRILSIVTFVLRDQDGRQITLIVIANEMLFRDRSVIFMGTSRE